MVRAFHNMCRHRGGMLEWTGTRGAVSAKNGLRCKYHGWCYNDRGSLKGTPIFGSAKDFRMQDYPLLPLRCMTYRDLIFVKVNTDGRTDVDDCVERLDAADPGAATGACTDLQSFTQTQKKFLEYMQEMQVNLEGYEAYLERTHTIKCNWKVSAFGTCVGMDLVCLLCVCACFSCSFCFAPCFFICSFVLFHSYSYIRSTLYCNSIFVCIQYNS